MYRQEDIEGEFTPSNIKKKESTLEKSREVPSTMARKQFNKNYKKPQKNKKKSSKPQEVTVIKKTLEDYRYDIGSSKNASEYVLTTKFIIHHIATTFDEADDIATALSDGKDFDLDAARPSLQVSLSQDSEVQKRETRQFELVFEKEADAHVARTNKYRQNKPKAAASS